MYELDDLSIGIVEGSLLCCSAGTLSAVIAFLIARYGARKWVTQYTDHNQNFKAIDRMIGEDSFRVIVLLRITPLLPISLMNYLYGLTRYDVLLINYLCGLTRYGKNECINYLYGRTRYGTNTSLVNYLCGRTRYGNNTRVPQGLRLNQTSATQHPAATQHTSATQQAFKL
jgi:hypothetical protein